MKKYLALLACVMALAATVPAQTAVTVATDNIGYSGSNNGKCVVRDSQGVLYMVRMSEPVAGTRTLVMDASYDGGTTWLTLITTGINDANSGETGSPLVAQVSLAIDDQDRLHVIWQRGTSGLYNQYYCSIDPFALTVTPYIDLKALMGVNLSTQTGAAGIAVDANGTVWMAMGSSSSWRAQLIRSDTPYATSGTFTSVGQISVSASAQSARIAVDLNGLIHCTYYENTGTGDYRHRAYDPVAASWSVATDLGNLSPTNDYTGAVVCDYLGNAHMVSMRDSYTSGTGNPTIVYYKRDASGTFSAPITVMSATNAQYIGVGNQYVFDIACDEVSGDVYVVFRDFSNGAELTVHVLPFGASAFTPLVQLAPANSGQHYYYAPRIRGSLYPASNNTGSDLHFTWRQMWPAPYDLKFLALGGTMPPTALYPGNGTDAATDVGINGTPDFQLTNVHSVAAGDAIRLTFYSPNGTLTPNPFLALAQIFTTGLPATPQLLPGDAMATVMLNLSSPITVLVNGLANPGTFLNPILDDYSVVGNIPLGTTGLNISAMIVLLVTDPGLNAVNLGNAPAHELMIN